MAGTQITLDASQFEALQKHMLDFGEGAGQTIDEVLHGVGAQLITEQISLLLPRSGRDWRGKPAAAASVNPFEQRNGSLSVTIATKAKYSYLYFPDDGSNTRHHAGNQHFMERGAEAATDEIVALCINALIKRME